MTLRSLRSIVAGQPPATAEKSATVLDAALLMKKEGKGALLVVDGIAAHRHLHRARRAVSRDRRGPRSGQHALADVMTPQPQTMHPDEPFVKALRLMHRHGFRHLPVVEHGRPLGVVSARDALDDDLDELRVDLVQRGDERD